MDKIYLLIGNDTPLAVCLRKSEGEETPVPYDLSEARHLRLTLVGHGMRVCAKDIEVSGDDNNVVSGMIPGRSLLKGDYDLEVTFTLDGRDKRFAIDNMFEAVDFLAEDADGEAEGEGAGIFVTVTVQPELIEIAGPTGPQGKSAYQVWLDDGHTGTEDDFFEWLAAQTPNPDWEQNDPSKADYIKNRTHWEEESSTTINDAKLAWSGSTPEDLDFWFHGTNVHIPRTSTGWGLTWQGGELFIDDNGSGYELGVYNGEEWSINPFDPSYDQQPYPLNVDVVITSGTTVHKLPNKFLDMDSEPTTGSGKPVTSGGVKAAIADFVTRAVNDLLNYYTKTETYTKTEVNQLVAGINNWEIVPVAQLPEASADTMHKIYLVPSSNPKTRNVKDEFITVEVSGAYSWEQIGTTAIDLTNYVTKQDLTEALADYVTSTAFTQALATKQDVISDLSQIRAGATNTVKYTSQTLTDAQKEQSRTNIGAASDSEVSQLRSKVGGAYTDNARVNSVIRSLYIDLSGYTGQESLHDLYFTSFGYYQPTDSYYFQLKNYTGTFLTGGSFPRQSFNGHIYVEGNGVKVSMDADLSEFYNNTPHQMTIEKINPIAYVKQIVDEGAIANNSVTTNKIADAAVTMNKLAKGGELNEVIDFESRINKSILVDRMPDAIKTPDYFLGTNGAQVGPYPGAWAYYTLDVSPGEKYEVSSFAGQNARLWLLLNNNSVVSLSSDSSAASQKTDTIEIPIGVNKLVVNSAQYSGYTSINEIFIYVDAERVYVNQNLNIKQYVDQQVSNPANILAGKVLVCCGDSITEGVDMDAEGIVPTSTIDVYQSNGAGVFSQVITNFKKTYGYQIAERNGMTFYNAGVSGSTMQGLANKNGFSLADGRYTKLPDNIDYLTIWFGWNDTAYGTLGTINDATNESYYGGYNVVVPYLQNKYPYAKICLIVPFGTDEGHRNAIRQLANRWGLACFDMYQGGTPLYYGKEPSVGVLTSVVSANQVKFQANGAHPNFKGHRQIGDMLEHFLRGI